MLASTIFSSTLHVVWGMVIITDDILSYWLQANLKVSRTILMIPILSGSNLVSKGWCWLAQEVPPPPLPWHFIDCLTSTTHWLLVVELAFVSWFYSVRGHLKKTVIIFFFPREQKKCHSYLQITKKSKLSQLVDILDYPSFISLVIFSLYLPLETETFSNYRFTYALASLNYMTHLCKPHSMIIPIS